MKIKNNEACGTLCLILTMALDTSAFCWWQHKYTCQLFLSQRREIFNWRVPGFPKTTQTYPKFSEDFRRRPKVSEDFPNNSEVLKKVIECSISLLWNWRFRVHAIWYSFTFSIFSSFRFSIWCKFSSLGKCFNSSCFSSHFSSRRENLVRKRELAWDWSFQLAGVRLTPKVCELAGIHK